MSDENKHPFLAMIYKRFPFPTVVCMLGIIVCLLGVITYGGGKGLTSITDKLAVLDKIEPRFQALETTVATIERRTKRTEDNLDAITAALIGKNGTKP